MTEAQLQELADYVRTRVGFVKHLRLRVDEVRAGRATFSVELEEPLHLNGVGVVHGASTPPSSTARWASRSPRSGCARPPRR